MKLRDLASRLPQLARKRFRIKRRPRVRPSRLVAVVCSHPTERQVAWLRRMARIPSVRVFAFVHRDSSCHAALTGVTVIAAADPPSLIQASDVVRTLAHAAVGAAVTLIDLTEAAPVVKRLLVTTPVPSVMVPSLHAEGTTEPPMVASISVCAGKAADAQFQVVGSPVGVPGPLVSVVMTTFNDGAFVEQAIASILTQTYANLEIVVVDDGSSDDTVARVRGCAANDVRVRLIVLQRNVGLFPARNVGLAAASGALITFQDADDVSRVDRIERCVAAMNSDDVDYVYSLFVRTLPDSSLTTLGAPTIYQEGIITLMLRTELVAGAVGYFDPLRFTSDSEFIERLRALRLREHFLPEVLYFARLRENSLTTAQGPLTIYTTAGKSTKSAAHAAYVRSYRAAHRQRGSLRCEHDARDRLFFAPPPCLGGDQERWYRHTFPGLPDTGPSLLVEHAAETLVRHRDLAGQSLRGILEDFDAATAPTVGVMIASNRTQWIEDAVANVARQAYPRLRVVVVDNSVESTAEAWRDALARQGVDGKVVRMPPPAALGACLNAAAEELAGNVDVLMKFDDDDYYSAAYVREQVAVHGQCGGIVGKFPLLYYSAQQGELFARPPKRPSMARSPHVAGGTLTFSTALWWRLPFDAALSLGEDRDLILRARQRSYPVTASSLFNHCNIRRAKEDHTWKILEDELLGPSAAAPLGAMAWSAVPPLISMNVP